MQIENQELINEFKVILDEFKNAYSNNEANKNFSNLFLIYSEIFNPCSALFVIYNKNLQSCRRIGENTKFSFKEKISNKKIIGLSFAEQNFLNYSKITSKIRDREFFILSNIKNDVLQSEYILSLNNIFNKYQNHELINFAYYLHKIKYGKVYVNNNKIFNIEISLLGFDFESIKLSELFMLKAILNQNEILKYLKIKIINLDHQVILKDAELKFYFNLKSFDLDGKFDDFCDFNKVLLINYFKENFNSINYKIHQSKYDLITNKNNILNPILNSIENVFYIKDKTKQAMYSKAMSINGTIDNNSYEFQYPNQIMFEFDLFKNISDFENINVFGYGYWQQNINNVDPKELVGSDVYIESEDISFLKLKNIYHSSNKDNSNVYNSLIKILNLSNKLRLKENDFRFLMDFIIENKNSLFCIDYDINIDFVDDIYHIDITVMNDKKNVLSSNILDLFRFLLYKLCKNIMPICYEYNIKIKSSVC